MEKSKLIKALSSVKVNTTLIQYFKQFLNLPKINNRKEYEDIFAFEFKEYLTSIQVNPDELLNKNFLKSQSADAVFFTQFLESDKTAIHVTEQKQVYEESFLAASQGSVLLGSPDYYRRKLKLVLEKEPGSGNLEKKIDFDTPLPFLGTINCIASRHDGTFLFTETVYSDRILKIACNAGDNIKFSEYSRYIYLRDKPEEKVRIQGIASLSDNRTVLALGTQGTAGDHLSRHSLGTRILILSENGLDRLNTWKTDVSTVAVTSDNHIITGTGYVASRFRGLQTYWTGKISVWDQEGQLLRSWDAPTQYLTTAGKLIFSYGTVGKQDSKEGLVTIWDSETGEKLKCFAVSRIGVEEKFSNTRRSFAPAISVHGDLLFVRHKIYKWTDHWSQTKIKNTMRKFFFSQDILPPHGPVDIIENYLYDNTVKPSKNT